MNESLQGRALAILMDAIEQPQDQRVPFVEAACGADDALLREALSLLSSHSRAGDFLGSPTAEMPGSSVTATGPAQQPRGRLGHLPEVDGYHVTRLLGSGGMGDVYHALQLSTRREVALKLMRATFVSERMRLRFDREVQLSARLDHPNVARVFDSGLHQGVYFYAMELIDGVPLDRFVEARKLGPRPTVELFATVCLGVAHAHLRGVIHRDLKPGNILVSRDGRPHLVDFGLAKELLGSVTEQTAVNPVTVEGEWSGTPAYMSPEQAAAKLILDTRTDVYSLGVILYRLVTGQFPHDTRGTIIEVVRRVCESDARPPRQVRRDIDRELEAVLLKALSRAPEGRYASAGEMVRDLENYLRGEPLMARPATTVYFLRKRLWRHRLPVGLAAGILALLAGMAAFSYVKIVGERGLAQRAQHQSEIDATEARGQRRAARLQRAAGLVAEGDVEGLVGNWDQAKASYVEAYGTFSGEGESPARADIGLWNAFRQSPAPLNSCPGDKGHVKCVAIDAHGRTAVTGSKNGDVRVYDLMTGRSLLLPGAHQMSVLSVAISPDGRIAMSGGEDGALVVWEPGPGGATAQSPRFCRMGSVSGRVKAVALSPDGRKAVSVSGETSASLTSLTRDDTLTVWDTSTCQSLHTFQATGRVTRATLSPDGSMLLTAGGELALWDVGRGQKVHTFTSDAGVTAAAFSPDANSIVSGDSTGDVLVWDRDASQPRHALAGRGSAISAVAFGAGATIVSAAENHTFSVWGPDSDQERRFIGPSGATGPAPDPIAFSADGGFAVYCSPEDTLTVWAMRGGAEERALAPVATPPVESVAFFPDGLLAFCATRDGPSLRDVATGEPIRTPRWAPGKSDGAAVSADGRRIASVQGDSVTIWELPGFAARTVSIAGLAAASRPIPMAFSPDARLLVVAAPDSLSVIDAGMGTVIHSLPTPSDPATCIAFSPDGRFMLSGSRDGTARLWDAAGLWHASAVKTARPLIGHTNGINAVAFSPDGRFAATASGNPVYYEPGRKDDFSVLIWDVATCVPLHELKGHASRVRAVAFLDNDTVVSAGDDSANDDTGIKLWDVPTSRVLRTITGRHTPVTSLAVSPDRRAVLSGGEDGSLVYWDLSVPSYHSDIARRLPAAMQTLQSNPNDPAALQTCGQWYASQHVWGWAADTLQRARNAGTGADADALTLARCYWATGQRDAARREFDSAMNRHVAPKEYLLLCTETLPNPADTTHPTTESAKHP